MAFLTDQPVHARNGFRIHATHLWLTRLRACRTAAPRHHARQAPLSFRDLIRGSLAYAAARKVHFGIVEFALSRVSHKDDWNGMLPVTGLQIKTHGAGSPVLPHCDVTVQFTMEELAQRPRVCGKRRTILVVSLGFPRLSSFPDPLPYKAGGFLDNGAKVLHFRVLRSFFQRALGIAYQRGRPLVVHTVEWACRRSNR